MKYRKKPVVVDAIQISKRFDWPEWFHQAVTDNLIITHNIGKWTTMENSYCTINTLEGVVFANEGDYIVKGSFENEIWPVRKDIFEATYEVVNE